ncbi:hypothetical protein [Pseudarthrobacter oxydans]|uniref:hypothetical protein n=1 Tax=Pseudarthrobacter oxydans TaxID=1671 RepID=UPI003830F2D1
MAVSAQEFSDWLRSHRLPDGTSELSKLLGINRATLNKQRLRGRVSETIIVGMARVAHVNPIAALGEFSQYRAVPGGIKPPTDAELLSQMTYTDVMVELLRRSRADLAHRLAGYEMSHIPHDDAVRAWLDAVDPGDIRRQIAERMGLKLTNLSALLTENRLPPEVAVAAAELAGTSSASGLVVTGLVTPQEAGWPLYCRENSFERMDDLALIDATEAKLKQLRRTTKKKMDAEATVQNFWETLG